MVVEVHLRGSLYRHWFPRGYRANVTARVDDRRVGRIEAYQGAIDMSGEPVDPIDACWDDLAALEDRTGRPLNELWVIQSSDIDPQLQGLGLGVALYATLVELVGHSRPGAVVMAGACEPALGTTSPFAQRVWSSQGLSETVEVVGLAATTMTGPERPTGHPEIERRVVLSDEPHGSLKASLMPPL